MRRKVTVIGAGGIGAATCLALAKMGVPFFTIIDDDVVSDVNMPTQLHRLADLGCDMAQGFCFSKARPDQEFVGLLAVSPPWKVG